MSNIVAIVGRPNVGKSTLFNRLVDGRKAIVNEESGVTRDRNYGKSEWNSKEFSVIDTGGYVSNSSDIFEEEINKQVLLAMDEADVILFVCDVELGITDLDHSFARMLRKVNKPIYLVANKVDNGERLYDIHEFYKLGVGEEIFPVASINGSGTGDLLDKVVIIGPSGSGKSTFLRSLNLLEEPSAGSITFDGVEITSPKTDIDKVRRQMGMVFQHFNLFPNMTIKKNITLAPVRTGLMSQAEADEKAMQLLRRVGLEEKADAYPNQLSGGQKQRIAIVCAPPFSEAANTLKLSYIPFATYPLVNGDTGAADTMTGEYPGTSFPDISSASLQLTSSSKESDNNVIVWYSFTWSEMKI